MLEGQGGHHPAPGDRRSRRRNGKKALTDLGYDEVRAVRFDRSIILDLEEDDATRARDRAVEMCNRVLVNPVLEDYTVEVET